MLMQHICIFMYIKYTLIIVILWDTLQKTYKIHMITYNYIHSYTINCILHVNISTCISVKQPS